MASKALWHNETAKRSHMEVNSTATTVIALSSQHIFNLSSTPRSLPQFTTEHCIATLSEGLPKLNISNKGALPTLRGFQGSLLRAKCGPQTKPSGRGQLNNADTAAAAFMTTLARRPLSFPTSPFLSTTGEEPILRKSQDPNSAQSQGRGSQKPPKRPKPKRTTRKLLSHNLSLPYLPLNESQQVVNGQGEQQQPGVRPRELCSLHETGTIGISAQMCLPLISAPWSQDTHSAREAISVLTTQGSVSRKANLDHAMFNHIEHLMEKMLFHDPPPTILAPWTIDSSAVPASAQELETNGRTTRLKHDGPMPAGSANQVALRAKAKARSTNKNKVKAWVGGRTKVKRRSVDETYTLRGIGSNEPSAVQFAVKFAKGARPGVQQVDQGTQSESKAEPMSSNCTAVSCPRRIVSSDLSTTAPHSLKQQPQPQPQQQPQSQPHHKPKPTPKSKQQQDQERADQPKEQQKTQELDDWKPGAWGQIDAVYNDAMDGYSSNSSNN